MNGGGPAQALHVDRSAAEERATEVRPQSGAAQEASAPSDLPQFDKLGVIGNALWLMCQSAAHKHLFLSDIDWLLVPPVALHQFRLWRRDNLPVAFASWAFLGSEAEERIRHDIRNLREDDWRSGEQAWLIDIIAPFGGADEAVKELREKIFVGRTVKTLRPAPDGRGFAVMEW